MNSWNQIVLVLENLVRTELTKNALLLTTVSIYKRRSPGTRFRSRTSTSTRTSTKKISPEPQALQPVGDHR